MPNKNTQRLKEYKIKFEILQRSLQKLGLPVILLFEGFSAAGKGKQIGNIITSLDPRFYKVYSLTLPNSEEKRYPFLKRYFEKIPSYGKIAIFDRSWYQDLLYADTEKEESKTHLLKKKNSIEVFERQLSDDGYLILKFFLHINKKEQAKRLRHLSKHPATAWRVTKLDLKRNRHFKRYFKLAKNMLLCTNFSFAPWQVISSTNEQEATQAILKIIVSKIESFCIEKNVTPLPMENQNHPPLPPIKSSVSHPLKNYSDVSFHSFPKLKTPKSLSHISDEKRLSEEKYTHKLKKYQKKLQKLHPILYAKKVPVILVFEGLDAAGKGGTIKRITGALDPRGCMVHPIASPTAAEKEHHYLWRFWQRIPKKGHIAIFDRSWYGRVLVEKIEGFCTKEASERAYQEINEFEKELEKSGYVILKFFLYISKEEQLKRFKARENNPQKRWKITDEDWRNREKWDLYEKEINEMIIRTSTEFAPWHIINNQQKAFGRIQTLKILTDTLQKAVHSKDIN